MGNVQFEQEDYRPIMRRPADIQESRPWFIRLFFTMGFVATDNQANILSVVISLGLIIWAVFLFFSGSSDSNISESVFRHIPGWQPLLEL